MKDMKIIDATIAEMQSQMNKDSTMAAEYQRRVSRSEGAILALQYLKQKLQEAEKPIEPQPKAPDETQLKDPEVKIMEMKGKKHSPSSGKAGK